MSPSVNTVKILLILVAVLLGTNVGLIAGMLRRADGGSMPDAIQFGGGAFGGTVAVVFIAIGFWYGVQNRDP
ncbi:hypothetical protein [Actinomadura fibrosa]|uniref:Uncharacterized protein n=1 Tax=Actinomadura fibrosa TaxID=111802 RepID=A0ABW2X9L0_9ACTN|nr:hypothetical protein [Actinomadura fibrosa]